MYQCHLSHYHNFNLPSSLLLSSVYRAPGCQLLHPRTVYQAGHSVEGRSGDVLLAGLRPSGEETGRGLRRTGGGGARGGGGWGLDGGGCHGDVISPIRRRWQCILRSGWGLIVHSGKLLETSVEWLSVNSSSSNAVVLTHIECNCSKNLQMVIR